MGVMRSGRFIQTCAQAFSCFAKRGSDFGVETQPVAEDFYEQQTLYGSAEYRKQGSISGARERDFGSPLALE
jgi:hypothetical protein